jgi:hypothetical protein
VWAKAALDAALLVDTEEEAGSDLWLGSTADQVKAAALAVRAGVAAVGRAVGNASTASIVGRADGRRNDLESTDGKAWEERLPLPTPILPLREPARESMPSPRLKWSVQRSCSAATIQQRKSQCADRHTRNGGAIYLT